MSSPRSADIRAVTLDVGDTLIQATPSVGEIYAGVCRSHGVDLDPDRCNQVFENVWRKRSVQRPPGRDRFSSGDRGEEGYWADLVAEVMGECQIRPVEVPPISAFRDAFASPSSWKVFDEVPGALARLEAAGYRLAVISNWDSQLPGLLRRLDLHRYFSHVFVSALAGVEKPHPDFFDMAAEEMDASPAEVLHVGDRLREDYEGARNAGMQALWLDRRGNGDAAGDRIEPTHVIPDLSGAVSWLAGQ